MFPRLHLPDRAIQQAKVRERSLTPTDSGLMIGLNTFGSAGSDSYAPLMLCLVYFRRRNRVWIASIAPGCWSRLVCASVPVLILDYQKEPITSGTKP